MNKSIVMVLLSAIDNDSRVKKEINSLQKAGWDVTTISLNSKTQQNLNNHIVLRHGTQRMGLPGVSLLYLYAKFLWVVFKNGRNSAAIHCNDLIALPLGAAMKLLTLWRVKVVYDAHEFESNQVRFQSRRSIAMLQLIEGLFIRFADAVITVSDGIAEEYSRLYKIEKPTLVLNCPPYQDFPKKNLFREKFGIASDQTIFLYQGGLAKGRGIEILLDAFTEIEPSKVIVFMGYGVLEEAIRKHAELNRNIYFHPAVKPEVLLDYTSSADFGISTIENACLSYYFCLPNKMFEFVMAGLPVIVSNLPEMKRVVEENGIGVVAKENTVEGLRDAIQRASRLDRNEVEAGIAKCKLIYNWEEQEHQLRAVYAGLISRS